MVLHVIGFRDAFAGRAVLASRQFRFCSALLKKYRFKAAYDTLQATLKHYMGCQDLNCEQSCKALLLEDMLVTVTFLFFASKKFQRLGPFQ